LGKNRPPKTWLKTNSTAVPERRGRDFEILPFMTSIFARSWEGNSSRPVPTEPAVFSFSHGGAPDDMILEAL
jgi:hypothetical protein